MKTSERYNGWKNRQTWNCALWIGNDEGLYWSAYEFAKQAKRKHGVYARFIKANGMEYDRTPDNIAWLSSRVSYAELDDMMMELIS